MLIFANLRLTFVSSSSGCRGAGAGWREIYNLTRAGAVSAVGSSEGVMSSPTQRGRRECSRVLPSWLCSVYTNGKMMENSGWLLAMKLINASLCGVAPILSPPKLSVNVVQIEL